MCFKRLELKQLDENGDVAKTYESINQFITEKKTYRLGDESLQKLHSGEVIYIYNTYVCLATTEHKSAFKRIIDKQNLRREKTLIKKRAFVPVNILSAINKSKNSIAVLDKLYNLLEIHTESISSLSKKLNVAEGTIKPSLKKTPNIIRKSLATGKHHNKPSINSTGYHFIYIKDLIDTFNNV